tara:strand:- start:275 stop:421 length:147 start_codon:yes stop_codon:yes gene_type:complete
MYRDFSFFLVELHHKNTFLLALQLTFGFNWPVDAWLLALFDSNDHNSG